MPYAENTSVSVERSRSEIETVINRYGATHYAFSMEPGRATIQFLCRERKIRFTLQLPDISEKRFQKNGRGKLRTGNQILTVWEQACRQKWRALLLCIKGKLETVTSGIAEFEEEFLPYVVDPATNLTVYETIREPLRLQYVQAKEGGTKEPLRLTGPSESAM